MKREFEIKKVNSILNNLMFNAWVVLVLSVLLLCPVLDGPGDV